MGAARRPVPLIERAAGVSLALAGAAFVLAYVLLGEALGADTVVVGSPLWQASWVGLLFARVALTVGLLLLARAVVASRRRAALNLGAALAVLAVVVGGLAYASARWGPSLLVFRDSDPTVGIGDAGVFEQIVVALNGALALAAAMLIGSAVVALAVATAGRLQFGLLSTIGGLVSGSILLLTAGYGLIAIHSAAVLLAGSLTVVVALWIAVVGVSLYRHGVLGPAVPLGPAVESDRFDPE